MGTIKKLYNNSLVGADGTAENEVYPVTAAQAVYNTNGDNLEEVLASVPTSAGDGINIINGTISTKIASGSTLGGIKIGSGLAISSSGVVSVTGGGGGGGGTDLSAVWQSLTNAAQPVSPDTTTKIAVDHIPDITFSKISNLSDYFTDGSANSALRLAGNSTYSLWGVDYWSNGVPSSVTRSPAIYIGRTQVQVAAVPQDLNGINKLTAVSISLGGTYNNTDSILTYDSVNNAWHLVGNFYADGFISAGGYSSGGGGGGGGISLGDVWNSLQYNTGTYADYKINSGHLPDLPIASSGTAGVIKVGNGLTITNGVLSANSQGGTYTAGTGIDITSNVVSIDSTYQGYITNGNTAYGWGNHSGLYLLLTGGNVSGATTFGSTLAVNTSLTIGTTTAQSTYPLKVTGNSYFNGNIGVNGTPQSNYPLYVNGNSLLEGSVSVRGAFSVGTDTSNQSTYLYGTLLVASNATLSANLSVGGDTSLTGDLYLNNNTNFGNKIVFGNHTSSTDYVYLKENTDDVLTIYGRKGIILNVESTSYKVLVGGNAEVDGTFYLGGSSAYLQYVSGNSGINTNVGFYSDSYITAGTAAVSSDIRLKDAIEDISEEKAFSVLSMLHPKEWIWNDKNTNLCGQKSSGLIAQEVQDVLPFIVSKTGDYYAINYNALHAYEIAGLQSHERRIQELEKENEILKKKLRYV